jgi:hypothetical protein
VKCVCEVCVCEVGLSNKSLFSNGSFIIHGGAGLPFGCQSAVHSMASPKDISRHISFPRKTDHNN